MLVPIAEKVLCITMKTQTLEHIMKEIEPERMQTQLRHNTALIGIVNMSLAARGMHTLDAISMLKYRASSMIGEALYDSIWKNRYVCRYLLKNSQPNVCPLASIRAKTTSMTRH